MSFMSRIVCSMALLGSVGAMGCGGASNTPSSSSTTTSGATAKAQPPSTETAEQKFERQKADGIDKMCERLIDCSLQDAQENGSPEELAKLEKDRVGITAKARADCSDQYSDANLSPRQLTGIRACLSAATQCPVFTDCLVKATKR